VRDEGSQHREGHPTGERPVGSEVPEREPERSRSPRRARAPAGSNPSGSKEGYGFHGGRKPLKRRLKAEKVLGESAGAERGGGNAALTTVEEESSERGSPGAWGAERGFQGFRDADHREGSQTLRVRLSMIQGNVHRTPFAR